MSGKWLHYYAPFYQEEPDVVIGLVERSGVRYLDLQLWDVKSDASNYFGVGVWDEYRKILRIGVEKLNRTEYEQDRRRKVDDAGRRTDHYRNASCFQ